MPPPEREFPISFDLTNDGWCYANEQFSFGDACLTWEQTMFAGLEPIIFFWFGYLYYRWKKNRIKKSPHPIKDEGKLKYNRGRLT